MSKKNNILSTFNTTLIFEEEILYKLLNDKEYFQNVESYLEPRYFADVGNSMLYKKMKDFYLKTSIVPNIRELVVLFKDEPQTHKETAINSLKKVQNIEEQVDGEFLIQKTEEFIKKAIHTESLIKGAEGMGTNDEKLLNESFELSEKAQCVEIRPKADIFKKSIINAKDLFNEIYESATNVNLDLVPLQLGVLTMISGIGGVGKGITVLKSCVIYLEKYTEHNALLWFTEDSERTIQSRLKVLKVSDQVLERISIMTKNPTALDFKDDEISKVTEGYNFVVIDPISHFYFGDENNNSEVAKFLSNYNNSCILANNITIIVHHLSKLGEVRGASAWRENSRLGYKLTKENGSSKIKCERNKDNYGVPGKEEFYIDPWGNNDININTITTGISPNGIKNMKKELKRRKLAS